MSKEKVEMIRAAFYGRYSSKLQSETSIDAQRMEVEKYAKKNNITIVREYIDRACSGRSLEGRPQMIQLLKDSHTHSFDVVLVHKMDRLARNTSDSIGIQKELKQNGVIAISTTEYFEDTPSGRLARNINAAFNEFQAENIGDEARKGFKENAHNGIHTGGMPPLGYDVDIVTKRLVINEEEARAVRMIFELHNRGLGFTKIIEELNLQGFTTKKGNKFGKNSLHDIIRNKKYCGYYVYNRREKQINGKRNSHKNKYVDEIVKAKGTVPAIISEEVFNKAQELMNNRKIKSGAYSAKRVYLLSGKVVCGHCGCNMTGNAKYNGKGLLTVTYSCEHRRKDKSCPNLNIRRDKLDALVVDKIAEYIFKSENIPALTEKLLALCLKRNSEYLNTVKRIEKRIKDNDNKRKRIVKAIGNGYDEEDFKDELKSLREEDTALEKSLNDVKAKALNAEITEQSVSELQSKFKQYILSHGIGNSKILIDKFVDKVTENNNQIEIVLNI